MMLNYANPKWEEPWVGEWIIYRRVMCHWTWDLIAFELGMGDRMAKRIYRDVLGDAARTQKLKRGRPPMSEHFNTAFGYPTRKSDVLHMSEAGLQEFMAMCSVEPADFENCLACYAYKVACDRERVIKEIHHGFNCDQHEAVKDIVNRLERPRAYAGDWGSDTADRILLAIKKAE